MLILALAGCGASSGGDGSGHDGVGAANSANAIGTVPQGRPQVVEPTAGAQAAPVASGDPVGDVNAHAPSITQIKSELKLELVTVARTNARYIDPLQYVSLWERTDQGVDARMPVGAPILAPSKVKVLAIIPNWFAGQPLVCFELLAGPDAGRVQYVAEQITDIAPVGIVRQGQPIARFARTGTDIEYGWATMNGETLARVTSGYSEGQVTPAGRSIRVWLNNLGANAGSG